MKKRLDNIEFITELMTFSNYGALSQIFIIDAVIKHAEAVAKAKPEDVDSPMVAGAAWVGVAKEIKAKLDALH